MNHTEKPIGHILSFFLISFALFIDGTQALFTFIPFIGWIFSMVLDIVASITFFISMVAHDSSLVTRRGISLVISSIAEFIPIFNSIPIWTAFVAYTLVMEKWRHRHREQMLEMEAPPPRPRSGWRL